MPQNISETMTAECAPNSDDSGTCRCEVVYLPPPGSVRRELQAFRDSSLCLQSPDGANSTGTEYCFPVVLMFFAAITANDSALLPSFCSSRCLDTAIDLLVRMNAGGDGGTAPPPLEAEQRRLITSAVSLVCTHVGPDYCWPDARAYLDGSGRNLEALVCGGPAGGPPPSGCFAQAVAAALATAPGGHAAAPFAAQCRVNAGGQTCMAALGWWSPSPPSGVAALDDACGGGPPAPPTTCPPACAAVLRGLTDAWGCCARGVSEAYNATGYVAALQALCGAAPFPPACAGAGGGCGAPAAETCCVHVLARPAATLRVRLPAPAALASVSIWGEGAPLPTSPTGGGGGAEWGAAVSVGDGGSATGCNIGAPWSAGAAGDGAPAGFAARALTCGTRGTVVDIALPAALRGLPAGAVAVKVCTRSEGDGMGEAALWIQG